MSEPAPKAYEVDDEGIDFSDIPELDEEWFAKAVLRTPPAKEPISIRLDQHVLDYFRKQGKGYQTQINSVLRTYVDQAQRRERVSKVGRNAVRRASKRKP